MEKDMDIIEDFLDRSSYIMHSVTKDDLRELQVYMSKNDYRAIENLIVRNKELEKLAEGVEKIRDLTLPAKTDFIIVMRENYLSYLREDFIPKSKVKELKEKVHRILDYNAVSRGYQLIIDKEFEELLES